MYHLGLYAADMAHDRPIRPLTTLTDLSLDPRNANRGTRRGQALLAESLTAFGAGRSVLADRNGLIIAGNKTVNEAQAQALPIRVVQTTGDALVVVQRTDLDLLEDTRARQLALADNRIAELNLAWDQAVMDTFVSDGVPLGELWTETEREQLLGRRLYGGGDDEDAVVPIRATTLQRGDLLELGAHRLLCGDATDGADVARVLGDDVPALLITDPPYGVAYDPAWRVRAGGRGRHAVGAVRNDDRVDWREALAHFTGPVAYVWHAGVHTGTVANALVGERLRDPGADHLDQTALRARTRRFPLGPRALLLRGTRRRRLALAGRADAVDGVERPEHEPVRGRA
jgi:hypothetical protein